MLLSSRKILLATLACLALLTVSCSFDIKKVERELKNKDLNTRIDFLIDEPIINSQVGSVEFNSEINSSHSIKSVTLWVEKDGVWEIMDVSELDEYGDELITNSDFELFSFDLATYWNLWESDTTTASYSIDTGYTGSSQKISVIEPGDWGMFLSQDIEVEPGVNYEWSMKYKTSNTSPLWAKIVGRTGDGSEMVVARELFSSPTKWQSKTINYLNENYTTLTIQIFCNQPMDFWLDEMSFSELTLETSQNTSKDSFEVPLDAGSYRWYLEVVDTYGTSYSDISELTIP